MNVAQLMQWEVARETEVSVTTNPIWPDLELNLRRCGGKKVNNCLRYGTAELCEFHCQNMHSLPISRNMSADTDYNHNITITESICKNVCKVKKTFLNKFKYNKKLQECTY
jgi:hypothetical protein